MTLNLSRTNRYRSSPRATFGDVEYGAGGTYGPRLQPDFQLVIVYAGEATIQIDDSTVEVPAQHMILLLPRRHEYFRFSSTRATRHAWCSIVPDVVPAPLQLRLQRVALPLPLTARVHGLIDIALSLPAGDLPAADELLDSLAVAALHAWLFEAAAATPHAEAPDALVRAREYIDARLREPLSARDIARHAHVTPQHLTRLFRRHLQTTPMRYLWQLRTRRGVELLRRTGLSISEIAERVGFSSPYHFSRRVRQQYARSPRDLRRRVWLSDAADPALDHRSEPSDC